MFKKKYRYKKKKTHFFFGNLTNRIGKIYLRRTFSNVFITLTDLKNQVIICKTSGTSKISENKRRKRIAQAVETIMLHIYKFIQLYKIVNLHLFLKMRVKSHVYTLIKVLTNYKLNIKKIILKRKIAHNGVKGRNIRRL
jgi:ribosomal protein S11